MVFFNLNILLANPVHIRYLT